jgi:hypothetical protein
LGTGKAKMKPLAFISLFFLLLTACQRDSEQAVEALVFTNTIVTNTNPYPYELIRIQNTLTSAYCVDPFKVRPYFSATKTLYKFSDSLVRQIQDLKIELVNYANSKNLDVVDTVVLNTINADDYSRCSHILFSCDSASALKLKLHAYRSNVINLLHSIYITDTSLVATGLQTTDRHSAETGKIQKWEDYTFKDKPLAADILALTLLQNAIRQTEVSITAEAYNQLKIAGRKRRDSIIKTGHYREVRF